jgi:hypothetical protein
MIPKIYTPASAHRHRHRLRLIAIVTSPRGETLERQHQDIPHGAEQSSSALNALRRFAGPSDLFFFSAFKLQDTILY